MPVTPSVKTAPLTSAAAMSFASRASTGPSTRARRVAPSASRMPNSRVRCATEWLIDAEDAGRREQQRDQREPSDSTCMTRGPRPDQPKARLVAERRRAPARGRPGVGRGRRR